VDFFPPHHHQQIRAMMAGTLKGVISQRLVPTIDDSGRVPACEVLTMTGRVRDMIMDPNETSKLSEVIAEGAYYGMRTFDQSLFELYRDGTISLEQALETATHPHDFKLLVASEGQRSTSVTQIYGESDGSEQNGSAEDSHAHEEDAVPEPRTPEQEPAVGGAPAVSVSPPGLG
jgi:twitching motility protein PilT